MAFPSCQFSLSHVNGKAEEVYFKLQTSSEVHARYRLLNILFFFTTNTFQVRSEEAVISFPSFSCGWRLPVARSSAGHVFQSSGYCSATGISSWTCAPQHHWYTNTDRNTNCEVLLLISNTGYHTFTYPRQTITDSILGLTFKLHKESNSALLTCGVTWM
jgi:hypothetical protein